MDNQKIGVQIKLHREKKGWTQDELANEVGICKQSISKWETGKTYPSIIYLPVLANIFQCTIDSLLGYNPGQYWVELVEGKDVGANLGICGKKIKMKRIEKDGVEIILLVSYSEDIFKLVQNHILPDRLVSVYYGRRDESDVPHHEIYCFYDVSKDRIWEKGDREFVVEVLKEQVDLGLRKIPDELKEHFY